MPAFGEHYTAKCYVDQAISNSVDESLLLRLDLLEKLKLDEQASIIVNSIYYHRRRQQQSCVDSSSGNNKIRREMSTAKIDQDTDFITTI